jgi:hypothetical protein
MYNVIFQGGNYVLTIMDDYSGGWNVLLIAILECIEHIIGPGSHVEYPTGTKNSNFVEDHPRNIPATFGSNWPSGFGEEA